MDATFNEKCADDAMRHNDLPIAAKNAVVALNDWLHQYASEECSEDSVNESLSRIWKSGGTIAYITDVRTRLEAAIKAEEGKE